MRAPAALVERAHGLVAAHRRAVLGLAGSPGSGKSSLAAALVAEVPGAVVLGMDGFHLANGALRRLGRTDRKGAPDTFDAAGFVATLRRVRAGEDVWAPVLDRRLDEAVAAAVLVPADAPLVLVEGNYLLLDDAPWDQVRPLLDECWFLDVARGVRERRLVARHERFGESPARARAHALGPDAANAARVETTAGRADLRVDLTAPLR
ncbi:nucleoside/nucleotide kinase family protein [Rhodococcus aerolatus]